MSITPESESFLAKKPKVAPTFQGVDFTDNQAVADARDAIIREQWVKQMMQRLAGEEMGTFLTFGLRRGKQGNPAQFVAQA
jgi:hypothetical protein